MNRITTVLLGIVIAGLAATARADDPQPKSIGVDPVSTSKSLQAIVKHTGQSATLDLLTDSLNQHFLVELENCNKFKVIAGDDVSRLIGQQQVPVGVIRDPGDNKALAGKISGLDYLLVTTITEMKDEVRAQVVRSAGMRVAVRTVQATAIVKIYDTTTGELKKAIDVPIREEGQSTERLTSGAEGNGAEDHSLIETAGVDLAKRAVARVLDTVYPAQVAAVQDNVVFINRGEGSGIERDQVWEVYAAGQAFKDPATGNVLGQVESKVAEVVITDVQPAFSKGRITGNNNGVDVGAVLRMKMEAPSGPLPGANGQNGPAVGDPVQH